jgi:hypothetical protein
MQGRLAGYPDLAITGGEKMNLRQAPRPAGPPLLRPRIRLGAGALAVTAAITVAASGCTSQRINPQTETVSTVGASAAAAAANSATCPSTSPQSLTSNVSGLSTELEPLAATKVLLCVYPPQTTLPSSGSDSSASSPASPTAVTITQSLVISSLQNGLNALTAPPTRPISCPNDTGGVVLGIFTDGQQETEVLMHTTGCPTATNGEKIGWVGSSDFISILSGVLKG